MSSLKPKKATLQALRSFREKIACKTYHDYVTINLTNFQHILDTLQNTICFANSVNWIIKCALAAFLVHARINYIGPKVTKNVVFGEE